MSDTAEILRCPVVIRALIWSEQVTVVRPGQPGERIITKRSHETFCVSGSTPEELMQGFLKCRNLNSPDQIFIRQ